MEKIKKKVLVTGAGGFIGSHLCELLVQKRFKVKAFVQYNSFNSWDWLDDCSKEIKNQIEVFLGDIRDPFGVKKAMEGCDIVYHLAALIGIPYSYHSPANYVDTNISGTLNIVQAAKELGVSRVLHTSTSEVYGTAQYVPIDESHPLQGQSPYSASKIGADQIALSFYNSFELPVTIVRPFNTYGPRQSARAIIPSIITQICQGAKSLNLGSLKPTRDFNFVNDTVNGFLAIAESEQTIGEVINIASNYEISMEDTVQLLLDLMDSKVSVNCEEERLRPEKSEVYRLWGDNSKILKLTDWRPLYASHTGLTKGLKETIKWFSNPENLKKYKSSYAI